jgi:hypothetical protein
VAAVYVERIIPLSLTLVWSAALVWAALGLQADGYDNWGRFQRTVWPAEVAIVAAVVAQVAAWRGWYWPLRLLLHAAWIGLVIYQRV